jgi:hypothetical protein
MGKLIEWPIQNLRDLREVWIRATITGALNEKVKTIDLAINNVVIPLAPGEWQEKPNKTDALARFLNVAVLGAIVRSFVLHDVRMEVPYYARINRTPPTPDTGQACC